MNEELTQVSIEEPINAIPLSGKQLAELEGRLAVVKVSLPDDRNGWNQGWYLFEVKNGTDTFSRQDPENPLIIDRKVESRRYHQFDRNLGVILNAYHYDYQPIGSLHPEKFEETKQKLIKAGLTWRSPQ